MLFTHFTQEILGLQDSIVKKVEKDEKNVRIEIELPRKEHSCPFCQKKTAKIHDYRLQKVKDLPCFGKNTTLILRKRRYACSCGKKFYEENTFLPKYQRRTGRTTLSMIQRLAEVQSYTAVGKEYGISPNSVMRIFNMINYPKPKTLPEVLGIDEFMGNSGKVKYHCILTDIQNGKVIDILHTRREHDLCEYFKKYDRSGVKYFVSDMYTPYAEIAKTYFKNATYVIDKYHYIRQTTWAFEAVRKEVQKQFSKEHRIYFKHSRKLLMKRHSELKEDEKLQVNNMLYVSPTLSTSYFLKEQLYRLLDSADPKEKKKLFAEWIEEASESEISAFEKAAKTYRRWFVPITNSFDCPYTNGFTEGCNNKIKALKRISYGCQNFKRFRNRILYIFSKPQKA